MKTNLTWRFITIFLVAISAALYAWFWPPSKGIDLAGGVSQVYELDLTKLQGTNESPAQIAAQVIDVLRRRIDPQGVRNIVWRVVSGKRIQIEMPLASKETQEARQAQVTAQEALQKSIPRPGDLEVAFHETGDKRVKLLEQFAPADSPQLKELETLGADYDALQVANKVVDNLPVGQATGAQLDQQLNARQAYDTQLTTVMKQFVDMASLKSLMDAADDPGNKKAQADLEAFPAKYPLQQQKINQYVAAHRELMKISGGGIDDPAELQRLITKAGVLDFRITVAPSEVGGKSGADYQNAIRSLSDHGPDQPVLAGGVRARWFMVDPTSDDKFSDESYVVAPWTDQQYILCYDDIGTGHPTTAHCLTHNDPDRKPWRVTAGIPAANPNGDFALPFTPDAVGAGYMGALTDLYKNHSMAILLDDKVISAPNIESMISDHGEITFGRPSPTHPAAAIQKEAEQLKQIMDSGSLPAALQPEPISVENISSEMGADNITAGVHSAYVAVVAVVGFMFIYYTITGAFADLALMLNLVLVLASMSLLHATFTLPGIAGLVLTLGMAVDANVLINERIREEIHRGASLWMAIKQGYDKVFWTIFDANLTCSLTSIVLIYVGSEEVKGFGVTLLIGLVIHMFTALFVTRTFMMAAVKWGIIKFVDDHSIGEYLKEIFTFTWLRNGHWPFMRVITVSNIDWIGKRYIFWGVSAVVMIAGLTAFVARGEDKYDIEFRGGTQITFQLVAPKDGKPIPDIAEVRKRIYSLKDQPGLADLADARVYTVGPPEEHRFEMQTTIANKPQDFEKTLPGPLDQEFAGKIDPKSLAIEHDYSRTKVDFNALSAPAAVHVPGPATAAGAGTATKPAAPLTLQGVKQGVAELAKQSGLEDLAEAEVDVSAKNGTTTFEVTIPNQSIRKTLEEPLARKFADVLNTQPAVTITGSELKDARDLQDRGLAMPITADSLDQVFAKAGVSDVPPENVTAYKGGVAFDLEHISPPLKASEIEARIKSTSTSPDYQDQPNRTFEIIPITAVGDKGQPERATSDDTRPLTRAILVTSDPAHPYDENNESAVTTWRTRLVTPEWKLINDSLSTQKLFDGVTSFDAVVAGEAKGQALIAIVLSLVLIVIYVWIRFGGIRYGLGAIFSLVHDAIVALAGTVLSGVIYNYVFHKNPFLLLSDFKINLTMIAAYLTVIGYSVNDTIVIFDRVRELRGKSHVPLTPKLINDAINQCFGRTIWTTFTVFIVVLILYIWGGEGVHGFAFAMLIGVITGAYSTLAIASPMLLATGAGTGKPGGSGPSPFLRKDAPLPPPELGTGADGQGSPSARAHPRT